MKENKIIILKMTLVLSIMILGASSVSGITVDGVDDLNQDGIIIALQSGTTSDLYAADNLEKAEIKAFTSFDKVIEALINEDAHFALGDHPVLSLYASENAGFAMIDTFSPEDFGIAVRQDSDELLDALNVAITAIVDSGDYDTIYSTWFDGDVVLTDDTDTATATAYPTNTSGSDLSAILAAGEIVFGSDTTYPPFESIDDDGTTIVGFDADIAHALAAEISTHYGVTVVANMFTTAWDPIIPDLKIAKFDAILSAMTKTAARAQQVDFTRAYYTSAQGVLKGTKSLPSDDDGLPVPVIPVIASFIALALIVRKRK